MKKLSIIFILITCSILFAETTPELKSIVQDYYSNNFTGILSKIKSMHERDYFIVQRLEDSDAIIQVQNICIHNMRSTDDDYKMIGLLSLSYYIISIRESKYPLKHIYFRDIYNNTIFIYSVLSDDIYYR